MGPYHSQSFLDDVSLLFHFPSEGPVLFSNVIAGLLALSLRSPLVAQVLPLKLQL